MASIPLGDAVNADERMGQPGAGEALSVRLQPLQPAVAPSVAASICYSTAAAWPV